MLCYGSLSKWIQGKMEIHHQVLLIPKPQLALSLYHGKHQPVMWETVGQESNEWYEKLLNVVRGIGGQGWRSGKASWMKWACWWLGQLGKDADGPRGRRRASQATRLIILLEPKTTILPSGWMFGQLSLHVDTVLRNVGPDWEWGDGL